LFADGTSGTDNRVGQISYDHSNNSMAFATSATERMRIDSSGNVGIGTSSPSSDLHIASSLATIRLEDSDIAGGAAYSLIPGSSAGNIAFSADPDNVRSSSDIRFNIDGSERMRIDTSGNLLVGTTDGTLYDNTTGSGFAVTSSGRIYNAVTSNSAQILNRMSTDGGIVDFRKDGTTVGSIGTKSSGMYIGTDDAGIFFNHHGGGDLDAIFPYDVGTNTFYNGHVNIGGASNRFKDAHFSGTVNAANVSETVYALSGTALDPANGGIQTKTLAANTTFTDSLASGESLVLQLEAGASYTVTWPTMTWVTSGGNVAPTLTAKDTLVFWKVSTTLYGAYTGSYV
jgi:hypothetical protein